VVATDEKSEYSKPGADTAIWISGTGANGYSVDDQMATKDSALRVAYRGPIKIAYVVKLFAQYFPHKINAVKHYNSKL